MSTDTEVMKPKKSATYSKSFMYWMAVSNLSASFSNAAAYAPLWAFKTYNGTQIFRFSFKIDWMRRYKRLREERKEVGCMEFRWQNCDLVTWPSDIGGSSNTFPATEKQNFVPQLLSVSKKFEGKQNWKSVLQNCLIHVWCTEWQGVLNIKKSDHESQAHGCTGQSWLRLSEPS